jgi:hypothetical protein
MLKIMSKRAFPEDEACAEHAFKRFKHHVGEDIGKKRIFSEGTGQNIEPDYTIPFKQHRIDFSELALPESSLQPSTNLALNTFTQEDQALHFSSALRDFLGRDERFLLDSCKPDPKTCQVVIYQPPLIQPSSEEDTVNEDDKEKFNKMDLS